MAPHSLRRDRSVKLATLRELAREYDAISAGDGRDWPAMDFVRWLDRERQAARTRSVDTHDIISRRRAMQLPH